MTEKHILLYPNNGTTEDQIRLNIFQGILPNKYLKPIMINQV